MLRGFRYKLDPTSRRGVDDAFRFQGREVETKRLNGKWSAERLPKIGWVKFRDTRLMLRAVRNVTVALDALGWHVSFACQIEHAAPINICPNLGIDRGVANTLALSTGERMSLPISLKTFERRKRRAQLALA